MSHTEQKSQPQIIAVIPARLKATRLPDKLLLPLAGKPLILHTLDAARRAAKISRVIIAADDAQIIDAVQNYGGEAILTDKNHRSGSDRIAEIAAGLPENSIIVNIQGDEPLIPVSTVDRAIDAMLDDDSAEIVTTCEQITEVRDVFNPNAVKVVTDKNNFALYFSRSPIPFLRDAVNQYGDLAKALQAEPDLIANFCKHTGLYVYRREYLLKFTALPPSELENLESLEQLRALENGAKIKVVTVTEKSIGVDTIEDFERAQLILSQIKSNK